MRWSDREAIGLFENIKNGVDVTDNYGRLIHNYENRGNSWRDREMVGLLTNIRAGVDVAANYGRAYWNYFNRGNSWGPRTITAILSQLETAAQIPPAPGNSVLPVISGTLIQGQTLSTTNGTWTNSPTSYTYQWIRLDANGLNPSNIGGATSSTHVLTSSDLNNKIRVKVTAINAGGSTDASSAITGIIEWTPTLLSTALVAAYDPTDPATLTVGSGTVSQWNDIGPNGYNLVQADPIKQPSYSATGFMGKPGVTFDGSNDFMSVASVTLGTTKFSAFAFLQYTYSNVQNARCLGYASGVGTGDFSSPDNAFLIGRNAGTANISGYRGGVLSTYAGGSNGNDPVGGAWYRFGSVWDSTNNIVYADTVAMAGVANSGSLHVPGTIRMGAYVDGSANWKGAIGRVLLMNRDATSDERLLIDQWLQAPWNRFVCVEGDSKATFGALNTNAAPIGYSWLVVPNLSPAAIVRNRAIGGSNLNSGGTPFGGVDTSLMQGNRPAWTDSSLPANKCGRTYILFVDIGSNSPTMSDGTGALQAADLATYCAARKAAGWDKIIITTILSRTDGSNGPQATWDAFRASYNAIIKGAGWAAGHSVDGIADFAADPIMGVDSSPTLNPTYWTDGVHPNAAGYARLETIMRAAINAI